MVKSQKVSSLIQVKIYQSERLVLLQIANALTQDKCSLEMFLYGGF
jgi:hypothetical protein